MNAQLIERPSARMVRAAVRDGMMTFDARGQAYDEMGNHRGRPLGMSLKTHDGRTVDSTGAFLVGELERLDLTLNEPLVSVSWGRDMDLREDVTVADEVSSFTLSTYASASGLGAGQGIGSGKAWIGKNTGQITGIALDIAKIAYPLRPWAMELKYTVLELESAAKMGRPVDQQKFDGLQLKHQMDIDEQVYFGDLNTGDKGLVNSALVTQVSNVPQGAASDTEWTTKTPDEILADVNTMLTTVWKNSAWAVVPEKLLIPPDQFGYISTQKVSQAGNVSILKYIVENNLLAASGRGRLDVLPLKWLIGAGAGGTIGVSGTVDRAVVYTKNKKYVRYPMTLLQRTPLQYDSIWQKTTYFCRLGVVEVVYPETIGYFDGL